jgi:hypothetical protein
MELSRETKIVLITITSIAALITLAVYNCEGQLSSKEIETIGYYTKGNCNLINDIEPSINHSLIKKVNNILNSYKYTKEYQENTFDCSDKSTICFQLLQAEGLEPWMAYRFSNMGAHIWIIVFDKWKKGIFIECCYTKDNRLGKLVGGNSKNFEYDSAWLMEPREYETYFKNIEKTSLTMNWNSNYINYIEQL